MRERLARGALVVLCLAAPLVYLPRVLLGRGTPLPLQTPPAWTHLVLVTVGSWPDVELALGEPRLAAFDLRASRVASVTAPSLDGAAAAASLWTGLYPRGNGVLDKRSALQPGAWTLARAARSAGTRTAAFLDEPFASATAIGGFDDVREEPQATPEALAEAAADFLARTRGERVLVWVHLARAGADGAGVAAVLERLQRALAETDRAPESLVVLALLARDAGAASEWDLDALAAPLWVALPGALEVGKRSSARLSLVDLPGLLLRILGLHPAPGVRLDARPDLLWNALRGGDSEGWVLVQGPSKGADVWTRGARRAVLYPPSGAALAETLVNGTWTRQGGPEAAGLLDEARAAIAGLAKAKAEAPQAAVPPGEWPWDW